jgi:hypothetical protein
MQPMVSLFATALAPRYTKNQSIVDVEVPKSVDMFPTAKEKVVHQLVEQMVMKQPGLHLAKQFHDSGESGKNSIFNVNLLKENPIVDCSTIDDGLVLAVPGVPFDDDEDAEKMYSIQDWVSQVVVVSLLVLLLVCTKQQQHTHIHKLQQHTHIHQLQPQQHQQQQQHNNNNNTHNITTNLQ